MDEVVLRTREFPAWPVARGSSIIGSPHGVNRASTNFLLKIITRRP
jgi:hypothetical protein